MIGKLFTRVCILLVVMCTTGPILPAQKTQNPFDLTYRIKEAPLSPPVDSVKKNGNPFDLIAPVSTPLFNIKIKPSAAVAAAEKPAPAKPVDTRFLLVITLGSLLVLTILATLFRQAVNHSFVGPFNSNALNIAFRDRQNGGLFPYFLLYLLFFFNISTLAYLVMHHYGLVVSLSPGWQILTVFLFSAGLLTIKHFILSLLGFIFPIGKEIRFYSFIIMVFNLLIGLVLTPVNLFLAFGSEKIIPYIIWPCAAFLAIVYLLRTVRGLFIANRFLFSHIFHFLLYICTVEIAPVLVLYKWGVNHLL